MTIIVDHLKQQLSGRNRASIYTACESSPLSTLSFRMLIGLSFWAYLAVYSTGFLHSMLGVLAVPLIAVLLRGRGFSQTPIRVFLQLLSVLALGWAVWQRSGPVPGIVLLLEFTGIILFLQHLMLDSLRAVYGIMILSLMLILGVAAMNVNFIFPLILVPYVFNFYLILKWIAIYRHEGLASSKISGSGNPGRLHDYLAGYVVSVGIFAFIWLVFFYLIPRTESFGLASEASKRRLQGFSETLRLGETGLLEDNPAVVMRVRPVEEKTLSPSIIRRLRTRLLRGTTFSRYDSGKWEKGRKRRWFADLRRNSGEIQLISDSINLRDLHQLEIILENTEPPLIFVPDQTRVLSLALPFAGVEDDQTLYFVSRASGSRKYFANVVLSTMEIQDSPVAEIVANRENSNYFTVTGIPERVKALAVHLASGTETISQRVDKAMTFLQRQCVYSLEQSPSGEIDPVENFLFESKSGSCEHFATALALLIRAMGIPSRPVSGYTMGEWNDVGKFYTVRQGHAHTWVEVYFPVSGWAPFDPTPAALDREPGSEFDRMLQTLWETYEGYWFSYVYNFDNRSQTLGFRKIWGAMVARLEFVTGLVFHKVVFLLILLVFILFGRRLRFMIRNLVRSSTWIPLCYLEWEAKLPIARKLSETPAEFHHRLLAAKVISLEDFARLQLVATLINEAAFSSGADQKSCQARAAELLSEIKL